MRDFFDGLSERQRYEMYRYAALQRKREEKLRRSSLEDSGVHFARDDEEDLLEKEAEIEREAKRQKRFLREKLKGKGSSRGFGLDMDGCEDRNLQEEKAFSWRRPTKIKNFGALIFKEGDDIEIFLKNFERAAYTDGANDEECCYQLVSFIYGDQNKQAVEDKEGFKRQRWVMLKREMKELWVGGLQPFNTFNNLKNLCSSSKRQRARGIEVYVS